MAITSTQTNAVETTKFCSISHLDTGGTTAGSYTVGFTPRYVLVQNETDRIKFEWYQGMTTDYAVKTIADGTSTLETSGGITVSGYTIGFAVLQNKQYRVKVLG